MKRFTLAAVLLAALVAVTIPAPASAHAPLRGSWRVTITPETGASLETGFAFKKKGKGFGGSTLEGGALAYREDETSVSISWEFAGPIIPTAFVPGPSTILLRGEKTSDTEMSGTVFIVTGEADPDSPTGFVTKAGTFTAVRQ